ncbi:MAG: hypothetical protein HOM44_18290, partial [Gammaproteobacteria bacterium]|nr:hypothetical protein [Gammaproteobacteria bacterium]
FGLGYLGGQVKPLWEKYTMRYTSEELLAILEKYSNVWSVEFADLGALMDHPQLVANDMVHRIEGKGYVRAPWNVPWPLPKLFEAGSVPG